jgi:hypothetical protein
MIDGASGRAPCNGISRAALRSPAHTWPCRPHSESDSYIKQIERVALTMSEGSNPGRDARFARVSLTFLRHRLRCSKQFFLIPIISTLYLATFLFRITRREASLLPPQPVLRRPQVLRPTERDNPSRRHVLIRTRPLTTLLRAQRALDVRTGGDTSVGELHVCAVACRSPIFVLVRGLRGDT